MAISIIDKLPYEKTVYWLLTGTDNRKVKVKKYIDSVAERWPALKTRIETFWTDNQEEYDNLVDSSLDNDWREFFNKFNIEADIIKLANVEALKEIGELFKSDVSDNLIIQDLKEVAQSSQHVDYLPDYFNDLTGGVCWVVFVVDSFKDWYLGQLASHLKDMFGESLSVRELNAIAWKKTINDIYGELYSSFTRVTYESDLDDLRKNLGGHMVKLDTLITDAKYNKVNDKLTSVSAELASTKSENAKLWKFVNKLTSQLEYIYTNYPEILYGTSAQPVNPLPTPPITPDPSRPSSPDQTTPQPKPQPINPDPVIVKPDPQPITPTKPDETTKPVGPTPEQIAAQELQALKNEIGALPLNATEKQLLADAKDKNQAEAVRTQYQTRIASESANAEQKQEIVKYDQILTDIQKETDITKLEDGNDYDNRIKGLKPILPPIKDVVALQTERQKKLTQLKTEKAWNDFYGRHGITDKSVWSSYSDAIQAEKVYTDAIATITSINTPETDLINKAKSPAEIENAKKQIATDRENAKWQAWFDGHKPDLTNLTNWRNSGLTLEESESAYKNNWFNNEAPLIAGKVIKGFQQEGITVDVNPLIHDKKDVDKSFSLVHQIKEAKAVSDLPTNTQDYNENKVPSAINFAFVKKLRDDKELEILKAIELRKYIVIATEIDDPKKNSFKSLPEDFKKADIEALNNDLLPLDKQKETLTQKIKDKRATFFYSLTDIDPSGDMEGKGIDVSALALAEQATTNVWDIREYDTLTPEILNEALNACEGIDGLQSGGEDDGQNIDQFLKDQGGYNIDEKEPGIEAKEAVLPKETRGTYLLPLFYKMNNYVYTSPEFSQWVKVKKLNEAGKEIDITVLIDTTTKDDVENPDNPKRFTEAALTQLKAIFDKGIKGQWAIGTGVGKTTKSMNCLLYMLKQMFPNG